MEFGNPDKVTTPAQCAQMFCSTIHKLFTYAVKNTTDIECMTTLDGMRAKFRVAYGSMYSAEQIAERVGPILLKWEKVICDYDTDFFMQTDLSILLRDADVSSGAIAPDLRARFRNALSDKTQTVILDALNLMLILYAKYCAARQ